MSENKGILLSVDQNGDLCAPAIRRENGQMALPAAHWDLAVKRMIILNKVSQHYAKIRQTLKINFR